jgi:aminoglycoside 2'-N-acetyltransferase I
VLQLLRDGDVPPGRLAEVRRTLWVAGEALDAGYLEGVATRLVRERFEVGGFSTGRPAFYERLGWEGWPGPTFVRTGEHLVRSPGDDGGVVVLRFGASAGVDLTVPIICETRPGDDW